MGHIVHILLSLHNFLREHFTSTPHSMANRRTLITFPILAHFNFHCRCATFLIPNISSYSFTSQSKSLCLDLPSISPLTCPTPTTLQLTCPKQANGIFPPCMPTTHYHSLAQHQFPANTFVQMVLFVFRSKHLVLVHYDNTSRLNRLTTCRIRMLKGDFVASRNWGNLF